MDLMGSKFESPRSDVGAVLIEPELKELVRFGASIPERACVKIHPGGQIGRYEVTDEIGTGGFGTVYLAHDPTLNRDVAIKIQTAPIAGCDLDEARTAALLSHPNVVPIHDVVDAGNGSLAIVMACVSGESARFSGDILETTRLLLQAAEALAHIHKMGYAHHDFKPSNILVDDAGHLTLCDFGLASVTSSTKKTDAGSPPYLSPERILGGEGDSRSDIWAFGVTMYELLTGQRPFVGRNLSDLFTVIERSDAVAIWDINPNVPRGLVQICSRCLEKNVADRYQSAEVLSLELRAALSQQSNRLRNTLTFVIFVAAILLLYWSSSLSQRNSTIAVREFINCSSDQAFDRLKLLPQGKVTNTQLRDEMASSTENGSSRARLALAVRLGTDESVVQQLKNLAETDSQLFLDIVSRRPEKHVPHLVSLLDSKSDRLRARAIATLLLTAPESSRLSQILSKFETRAAFLLSIGEWGNFPNELLKIANSDLKTEVKATALTLLGMRSIARLNDIEKANLLNEIASLSNSSPDAEVHGLCRWLIEKLAHQKSVKSQPPFGSNWQHGPLGMTLVRVQIKNQDYWVADSEFTVQQHESLPLGEFTSTAIPSNYPVSRLSWHDALEVCNQLSRLEGLTPCYIKTDREVELTSVVNGSITSTTAWAWELDSSKSGFRLPLVSEWESYSFLDERTDAEIDESHLRLLARFGRNSVAKCRMHQPSFSGLFDVHGNVAEWCWDTNLTEHKILHGSTEVTVQVPTRAAMGGSYLSNAAQCGNVPLWLHPDSRYPMVGFRVMRRIDD